MCSGQLYLYPELSEVHQLVQADFLCKSTTRKDDDDDTTDLHNDSDDTNDDDDDESNDSETEDSY